MDEHCPSTCQVVIGPPSQLACLAGKLILDELIVLARGADPTAAHLALPDHLHAERPHINNEGEVTDIRPRKRKHITPKAT